MGKIERDFGSDFYGNQNHTCQKVPCFKAEIHSPNKLFCVLRHSTSHQTRSISEHCRNTLSTWSSYSNPSLSWNDRQLNLLKIPSSCANTYHLSSPNNWRNRSEDSLQEHNQQNAGLSFTSHCSICSIVPVTGYKLGYGHTGPKIPISCLAILPAP